MHHDILALMVAAVVVMKLLGMVATGKSVVASVGGLFGFLLLAAFGLVIADALAFREGK
jgi:hypothetical protein